ncbi:hypothetical protein GIB67_004883 [Kingdonia uniflora]|uniref:fructose-bisphosphate aldolase n=1 Tax=Kingdonia uniflora TaxID=39325 RepID=A0A7J7LNU4_9MAGN|nr:hypothetical protein GIB67_004883 [Kingdonia uniflora]
MAAEICLSQIHELVEQPNAEFQSSPFFTKELTAFEVWPDHGCEHKKPPQQLPIVLQVSLSQYHRHRALVFLGIFLDMEPWAVDLITPWHNICMKLLNLWHMTVLSERNSVHALWIAQNGSMAHVTFLTRCKANSKATLGTYKGDAGKGEGASESLHVKDCNY